MSIFRNLDAKCDGQTNGRTDRRTINILTKFHKDWMKTVISAVYTNKLLMDTRTHAGRRTSHDQITDYTKIEILCGSLRGNKVAGAPTEGHLNWHCLDAERPPR
ncbi:hypothetical protein DPMN_105480 [Dreissena polymorpha]|uniref:Uncharacterized protein n=1 Tax=Dreissena polymorpha TaxID=45954 RepID=A0A9D4H9L2_DREPO|nr:hypothetical protein DPMN_105480 [Dreissena polymorpha]